MNLLAATLAEAEGRPPAVLLFIMLIGFLLLCHAHREDKGGGMKTVPKILILAALLLALSGCNMDPGRLVREYEVVSHSHRGGWYTEHYLTVRRCHVYESGFIRWVPVFQGTMPEILERNAQLKRLEQFNTEQARK